MSIFDTDCPTAIASKRPPRSPMTTNVVIVPRIEHAKYFAFTGRKRPANSFGEIVMGVLQNIVAPRRYFTWKTQYNDQSNTWVMSGPHNAFTENEIKIMNKEFDKIALFNICIDKLLLIATNVYICCVNITDITDDDRKQTICLTWKLDR